MSPECESNEPSHFFPCLSLKGLASQVLTKPIGDVEPLKGLENPEAWECNTSSLAGPKHSHFYILHYITFGEWLFGLVFKVQLGCHHTANHLHQQTREIGLCTARVQEVQKTKKITKQWKKCTKTSPAPKPPRSHASALPNDSLEDENKLGGSGKSGFIWIMNLWFFVARHQSP